MTDPQPHPETPRQFVGLDEAQFARDLDDTTVLAQVHTDASTVSPESAEEDARKNPTEPNPPTAPSQLPGVPGVPGVAAMWVGKILGHFKLQRLLGQGAMGMVVQAQDINLRRIVALKILRKRIRGVDEQASVQQFLREARAAAQLEHPNVVRVYEINEHRGWWYIAYELIEGGNLKSIVKAIGPLPPNRACPLIADAASALAAAHEVGIIHRDVKPSNLMLSRTGRCKIMDFGLVRIIDPSDPVDFTDKSVGTPQYMPPEIIQRRPTTPASDIYSLGATLYFALAGEPPYSGKTVQDIIHQHIHAPAPNLLEKSPHCSPILAQLVAKMLAKNPADRPTATEAAAALRTESAAASTDPHADAMSTGSFIALATAQQQHAGESPASATSGGQSTVGLNRSVLPGESFIRELRSAKRVAWVYALLGATIASLAMATGFYLSHGSGSYFDSNDDPVWPGRPVDFSSSFPDAPSSYGLAEAAPAPSTAVPAFSWSRHLTGATPAFVAARQGRYFYPADDPRAAVITPEQFLGFANVTEVRAAGKVPAPPRAE